MTFDERAANAAKGVRKAVSGLMPPPIEGAGVVAPARAGTWLLGMQAAAGIAVIALVVGYFSTGGFFAPFFGESAPVADGVTTTTTEAKVVPTTKPDVTTTTEKTPSTTKPKPPPTEPPVDLEIEILAPTNGSVTDDRVVLVRGTATAEAGVLVNGALADRDDDGGWAVELELDKGVNQIKAKAYRGDQRAYDTIEVRYDAPQPTTTTTKPKPPPATGELAILSPKDGASVEGSKLLVTGEATPGLKVFVNGVAVTWTDDARWKVNVPIMPGWNGIQAKGYVGETKVAYQAIEVLNGEPAWLAIDSPADGAAVDGEGVFVEGRGSSGLKVFVNGFEVDWLSDSAWKVWVPLSAGWNGIQAKGYVGETKVAYQAIEVLNGEAIVVPFTVTQVHGTSSATPPFEAFWGTATPNGKVWVQSPYGEAKVYADAEGNYEVVIYFEGAPIGEPFEVSVKDYEKVEYRYFTFTRTDG